MLRSGLPFRCAKLHLQKSSCSALYARPFASVNSTRVWKISARSLKLHRGRAGTVKFRTGICTQLSNIVSLKFVCRPKTSIRIKITMAVDEGEDDLEILWFRNEYFCEECQLDWADDWSCECNDRCPQCDLECEPVESIERKPDTPRKLRLAIQHAKEAREVSTSHEDLECSVTGISHLTSRPQQVRVMTEGWFGRSAYYISCSSEHLIATKPNTILHDFICGSCGQIYELKSSSKPKESALWMAPTPR